MDRNGDNWTGDDIEEKASAPGGAHEDASGEKPHDVEPTEGDNEVPQPDTTDRKPQE